MAALAATSSATPSLQSTLLQGRVQQARREADLAQATADRLREQANQQDRTAQQARERLQTLKEQSAATAGVAQSTNRQSSHSTPVEIKPTYTDMLAGAFQLAKPILNSDLSSIQKNVVTGGLFEAPSKILGRVLNTIA